MVQERERFLVRFLRANGWANLDELRAFEAGCSTGYNLRTLLQWGARPEHLAGIDLDPEAVDYCRAHSAQITVHCGSAEAIPEETGRFDLSLAFTLFSSVPDDGISSRIGAELVRITKPGGFILVYDMRRRNPRNADVHPIGRDDIERWFPGLPLRARSITLAPPIARPLGRRLPALYGPVAAFPFLRTHNMYVLRRK